MSAIYHRFGFLSMTVDEIGIGSSFANNLKSYVYNMGNQALNQLCNGESFNGFGTFYTDVCADQLFRIEGAQFDAAKADIANQNPQLVIWPPENGSDIPPAFYEESPDPLPSFSVSGYPISVQFNPQFFATAPTVTKFDLYHGSDSQPLDVIILMDANNDPNEHFSDYEYAIFPFERLEWNSSYRAELEYIDADSMTHQLNWSFTTRDPGLPVVTVTDNTTLNVTSGDKFALYLPPQNGNDSTASYQSSFQSTVTLTVDFIDGNTISVLANGSGQATITFHGRDIELIIAP
jgi:hypothetical protein